MVFVTSDSGGDPPIHLAEERGPTIAASMECTMLLVSNVAQLNLSEQRRDLIIQMDIFTRGHQVDRARHDLGCSNVIRRGGYPDFQQAQTLIAWICPTHGGLIAIKGRLFHRRFRATIWSRSLADSVRAEYLTTAQRAAVAADSLPLLREEAHRRQGAKSGGDNRHVYGKDGVEVPTKWWELDRLPKGSGDVRDIAAKAFNVGSTTINRAVLLKKNRPDLFAKVRTGEVGLEDALREMHGGPLPRYDRKPQPQPQAPSPTPAVPAEGEKGKRQLMVDPRTARLLSEEEAAAGTGCV